MIDWLNQTELLATPLQSWLYALAAALTGFLLASAVLRTATHRLEALRPARLAETRGVALVLLRATRLRWVFLLALVLAINFLPLPQRPAALLGHAVFALIGIQTALWATALVDFWLHLRNDDAAQSANPILAGMLSWATKVIVWALLLLAFLGNLGVNITAFVASLGVGGIAVALGLQTILGDLFSSIAIGLDKPFVVGEFIAFRDVLGTVTKVGAKTTRIESLSGEQLSISNSDLLNELVHNYSRMPKRRVVFGFRVPYGTSRRQIEAIVDQTRGFIEDEESAAFDRGHFAAFGDYGFDFEFVYYVLSSDYTLYRDIQQRVNLKIMTLLEALNASFAVPARQVARVAPAAIGLPEVAAAGVTRS